MQKIQFYYPSFAVGIFLLQLSSPSWATSFKVTNLVTDDQAANPAQITDTGLVNAWGLSYSPTSPFWVSSNGTGTSVLYSVNPVTQVTAKQALVVSIPGDGSVTGQVFNSTSSFNGDRFLFVSEDGTVSGWRGALGTTAENLATASPANVYKGAAFGSVSGNDYLYAANFSAATIDVFKGAAGAPDLTGAFSDPNLPAGYAPFNVQNLNGSLYVTYAEKNPDSTSRDEVQGPGLGIVNKFDLDGTSLQRVATGNTLNAPWGLAIAPSSFGAMAGDLLVGNFGDGKINAFDPLTFAFIGQVLDADNNPLAIDGLWAIAPGNDGGAGSRDLLYFTAGPDGETHGLFGVLTPVPEPSIYSLMFAGLLGLLIRRRVA
jgi:uncharacterized protein (TIGR03118 family)